VTKLGVFLLGAGLAAWVWCGERAEQLGTPPQGMDAIEALRDYPGARMEMGRWLGAGAAVLGLIVMVMPRGRSI
jgi:hypothetical protein